MTKSDSSRFQSIGGAARSERDEAIIARVLDQGATYTAAAGEFGLTGERVRQNVEEHLAAAMAE